MQRISFPLLPSLFLFSWVSTIYILSAQSGHPYWGPDTILLRKMCHVFEFSGLYLIAYWTLSLFSDLPLKRILMAAIFSISCAGFDEFHQTFVPARCGQFSDVLLDSAAILLAALLCIAVSERKRASASARESKQRKKVGRPHARKAVPQSNAARGRAKTHKH
ncbi:MAG: VanZ family protein [Candidatus Obscuribacterales bacterium]|nr:VanZ family protein [Candidatus Obscuribacterales bacterium]